MIESRKTEIRYVTSDPKRMLGKFCARRVLRTWTEDFVDEDTGYVKSVERHDVVVERGTYIDQNVLCQINFMMQEGSVKEVEVSNQNRQGIPEENNCMNLYKAVANIGGKRKTFLLYATSVGGALVILTDYIELNFRGLFAVTDIKQMDSIAVIVDVSIRLEKGRYKIDADFLSGNMSREDYIEATCDNIAKGNPDAEEDDSKKEEGKKFYQIEAHIVMHNDKEGSDIEQNHTFIVYAASAVRANMLIEMHLREKQEERYRESLKHPERTFVKYQINSFIEESKIIPVGCFIPLAFSEVYNEKTNGNG